MKSAQRDWIERLGETDGLPQPDRPAGMDIEKAVETLNKYKLRHCANWGLPNGSRGGVVGHPDGVYQFFYQDEAIWIAEGLDREKGTK